MAEALTRLAAILPVLCGTASAFAQDGGAGQAAAGNANETSWLEMFLLPGNSLGLVVVWLLLLMSAFSIGFAIKLLVDYRRATLIPDMTRDDLEGLLNERKYRDAIEVANDDPSFLGRLTSAALNEAANGYPAMERAMEEASDTEVGRYLRPVEYLNVIGNIEPMLGLFGTVYGMIESFQQLVNSSGNPDPAQLAGGISTALVTTFWGLVVAIPALAAYSIIRNKIDAMTSEGMLIAEQIISPFKPQGKTQPAAAVSGADDQG